MCKFFITTYTCGHHSLIVHPDAACDPSERGGTCINAEFHDIHKEEGCGTHLCPGWQPSDEDEDEDEGCDTHLCNGQQSSTEDEV